MIKPLHQGISVPDVNASIAWYQKNLGFQFLSDQYIEALSSRVVFLRLGDFELELFQYTGADRAPLPPERYNPNDDIKTVGTKHVAYATEDLTGLHDTLVKNGVDVVMPPFPMKGDLVCFIRDNSGILIELIEQSKQ